MRGVRRGRFGRIYGRRRRRSGGVEGQLVCRGMMRGVERRTPGPTPAMMAKGLDMVLRLDATENSREVAFMGLRRRAEMEVDGRCCI